MPMTKQTIRLEARHMQERAAHSAAVAREWRDAGANKQAQAWQTTSAIDSRIARLLAEAAQRVAP